MLRRSLFKVQSMLMLKSVVKLLFMPQYAL